jgi:outer membrane receptor protein involved in Fe transport
MLLRVTAAVLAIIVFLISSAATSAEAQLQQATITVILVDQQQRPVADTRVTLADPLGVALQSVATDGAGRALFSGLAVGRYQLQALMETAAPLHLPLNVVSAVPVEMTVKVPASVTDRIVVAGAALDETLSRGTIAGSSIAAVPARLRSRALQDVVATLPGWFTEDNGLLHVRGVDDGFLYVIDGVPIYERIDAVSGVAPDLSSVSALSVVTGYVPPEFGYKAGGVIEVRSANAESWNAAVDATGGSDALRDLSGAAGGRLSEQLALRVGGAAAASHRFLDPIHPDNFHNRGHQSSTFGQIEWSGRGRDRVSAGWEYGRSSFDVPNTDEQEEAGQDQRQRNDQVFLHGSWQRTWSSNVVSQAALYHRRTGARLDGSLADTPLSPYADRDLVRTGALFAVSRQQGRHLMKVGLEWQRLALDEVFSFAITDEDEAEEAGFREEALQFTPEEPFVFSGRREPSMFSAFAQDTWHVGARVTLSGGLRFDRSELLLTRTQLSPRVGAAFRFTDRTLVRAALSRLFQPPQPENLLLSSSPEARVLSSIEVEGEVGGADVEPERQWSGELGLEQQIGRARLDLAYWARRMREVGDPNVFAGTTIIFPNAVARGRAHGLEARLEVTRQRGWSGYLNWAVAKVIQTGPIHGGLFLEDEVEEIGPGVEFSPDHDQRMTAGGRLTWEHAGSGAAVSLTARYETGTPVQQEEDDLEELFDRPGAYLVDFEAGRTKPRTVVSLLFNAPVYRNAGVTGTVGVQVLNLFDADYAYNFGNPFSGTHFGARRSVAFSVRFAFR